MGGTDEVLRSFLVSVRSRDGCKIPPGPSIEKKEKNGKERGRRRTGGTRFPRREQKRPPATTSHTPPSLRSVLFVCSFSARSSKLETGLRGVWTVTVPTPRLTVQVVSLSGSFFLKAPRLESETRFAGWIDDPHLLARQNHTTSTTPTSEPVCPFTLPPPPPPPCTDQEQATLARPRPRQRRPRCR
jgi:hypothetical protein